MGRLLAILERVSITGQTDRESGVERPDRVMGI